MRARDRRVAAAEESLERLFRLSANRTMHRRQTTAVGADVTRAGYAVLRSLAAGEMTLGELARECAMEPAAAGRQVNALEELALVERRPADTDGRVTLVHLTDHGRDVYERIREVRAGYMRDVLAGWSDDDCDALTVLVDRLVDGLRSVPFRPGSVTRAASRRGRGRAAPPTR